MKLLLEVKKEVHVNTMGYPSEMEEGLHLHTFFFSLISQNTDPNIKNIIILGMIKKLKQNSCMDIKY